MKPSGFDRFAGSAAILAAICGLLYSVAFVILQNALLSSVFLLVGGLVTTVTLLALFDHLREGGPTYATLGLILGSLSALGAAIHGAYDLANALNPSDTTAQALANLPSQIDPRGFLTFGVAGLALLVAGYLEGHNNLFTDRFRGLTYLLAILLIIVYLGRLIILTASSPLILIPAALTGLIVNPLWYIWLGVMLLRLPGQKSS